MYRFQGLVYPDINNPLPKPKTQFNPVFRLVVGGSMLKEQVISMRGALDTAELAKTTILKDGVPVTGTDAATRNCYILSEAYITTSIRAAFDSILPAAWANFTFSSPTAVPNYWQCLAYKEGGFFVPHYDDSRGHVLDGKNYLFRNSPERSLTILMYLNDDYEGGEISFPNIVDSQGSVLRIKPKAGEVIAFPSHELFKHQVEPVTSGQRFVVSRWYDDPAWFRDAGQLDPQFRSGVANTVMNNKYQVYLPPRAGLLDGSSDLMAPAVKAVWQHLQDSDICHRHALSECYMEVISSAPRSASNRNRNFFETRINCVPNWQSGWGGSTVWFGLNGEAIYANAVDPWSIKQYRADTPKAITPVHPDAQYILKSLVFVSYRTYEIIPELRPKQWLL